MYRLQERLFNNVTDSMVGNDGARPNEQTNHAAWLAGHLVSTRFMLANIFGIEEKEPHPALFGNGKGIDADATYPPVSESVASWNAINEKLNPALENVSDEMMAADGPAPVPMGKTMGDFLAFIAHHEAYHLGQLGMLRKYFGQEAMSYR